MIGIDEKFPQFELTASVSIEHGKEFQTISNHTFNGKWLVVFAWPMDFTFVCPTEIAEFGHRNKEFLERNAQVLGLSTDSHYVHLAWRNDHPDLRKLPFPMLADIKRELSDALGIIHPREGVDVRATFFVDPEGTVRFAMANDLSVGRSVGEVLRVLDALQTGELCPCDWKKGERTLSAA